MQRVQYAKDLGGLRVVAVSDVPVPTPNPTLALDRYNALFQDVPLFGGKEWETLPLKDLIQLFLDAIEEGLAILTARRAEAIAAHNERSAIGRWWAELWGWQAPTVPTKRELADEMAARCRRLADWMSTAQHRAFYMESDMSAFVINPRAVADYLDKVR
jgi:hypothetical protein